MGLGEAQALVRTFHREMIGDAVTPQEPVDLEAYNGELRCRLMEEEAREFRLAWEARDRLGMLDALCDLLYVTLGAGVEMGVELEPFFDEVHSANMKKVGGRVREDGKQLKPAGWSPPDLAAVYARRYGDAPDTEPDRQTTSPSS